MTSWSDTFVKGRKRRGRLHRGHAATLHQFLAISEHAAWWRHPPQWSTSLHWASCSAHYEQALDSRARARTRHRVGLCRCVAGFLTDRFGNGPLELGTLDVSTITTFVIRHARTMSPGTRRAW